MHSHLILEFMFLLIIITFDFAVTEIMEIKITQRKLNLNTKLRSMPTHIYSDYIYNININWDCLQSVLVLISV